MKNIVLLLILNFIFPLCFSQTCLFTLAGHKGNVNAIEFSKDGKYLLSGGHDGTVRFWNVNNNFELEKTIPVSDASVTNIDFSSTGTELSVCTFRSFSIYDYPAFKLISKNKKAHTTFVKCANFSNLGDLIITSSWRDNSLIMWKTSGLKMEKVFSETEWTDKAIFLSDDRDVVSVNHANTIKLWDTKSGNLISTLAGHTDWVYDVFKTKEGKYLVSGSLDKTIKVWDLYTGKLIRSINAHSDGITSLCLSGDGKYFASGGMDKTIKIWQIDTFNEIALLVGHENCILSVAFSPDGKYLATSSSDQTIKIWDMQNLLK
jgi:WD40 repeat protein